MKLNSVYEVERELVDLLEKFFTLKLPKCKEEIIDMVFVYIKLWQIQIQMSINSNWASKMEDKEKEEVI